MNLLRPLHKIFDKLGLQLKADRSGSARIMDYPRLDGMSVQRDPYTDYDTIAKEKDAVVATAVRLISDSIAQLPLDIVTQTIDAEGEETFETANDHPVHDLLRKPNPYHTQSELIAHYAQSLILDGNAFTSIEKQGSLLELWPLEVRKTEVKYDHVDGRPIGYVYTPRKAPRYYNLDEMVHIRLYSINDVYYGRSRIEPIHRQIESDYEAERYNLAFFRNDATPGGVFTPETELTPEQIELIRKQWYGKHSHAKGQAHKIFIAPTRGSFETTFPSMKEAAFIEMLRMNREKVYALFGIPPSVGGVYEFANYANAKIQDEAFWRNTLIPLVSIVTDMVTRQLLWRHFDEDHEVRANYDEVHALKADELIMAQSFATLVRGGIMTPNEARQQGYDLKPLDGGDELTQTSLGTTLPTDTPKPTDVIPDASGKHWGGGRISTWTVSDVTKTPDRSTPQYKLWKAHDDNVRKYEIRCQKIIAKFFLQQRARVIENLRKYTVQGHMMSRLFFVIRKDDVPSSDDIFNMEAENAALAKEVDPFIRETIRDAGQDKLASRNIDMVFNINNPAVMVAIHKFQNRIKTINETTYDKIRALMQDAYDNGDGIGVLERNIRSMFTDMTRSRSITIARTEMNGVVNAGGIESFKQAGITTKTWLATQDDRTRDIHAEADGQEVRIDQPFMVGGEMLDAPGDPDGSPDNVINCRCTFV